jgi:acyl-CoA synthetase (AMP-forming)/AMP-acid ligase II
MDAPKPSNAHPRSVIERLSKHGAGHCRVQLITPAGARETSFRAMWDLSTRIAGHVQRELPPGRLAGVLTPSPETIGAFVGALRAGRDFVSLPLLGRGQDIAVYAQQLRAIVEAANVQAIVIEAAYEGLLQSLPAGFPCPVVAAERLAERASAGSLWGDPEPGDLIQFSSGTTGAPKGVRLSTGAIGASVEAMLDAIEVGGTPEAFCSWLPLSHDMGLIGGLFGTWVGCARTRPGYRYVCISPELFLMRPMIWMETCSSIGATVTAAPTFAYHLLSRHLGRGPVLDLKSLRACIVGAEPIGAETLRGFAAAGSRHGFREAALCPGYGLAEVCLGVSMVPPGEPWSTREVVLEGVKASYVSCGRLFDCVRVDAPAPGAGAGPVRVTGAAACSGFLPERPGRSEWIDTGDLGVLEGNELVICGRADDLVCVAGRNVFAWELERAASGVPHVRAGDCAALSDGRGRYVLLFESRGADGADIEGALVEIRRRLASVAGIGPSGVGCLPRGAIAKTPSGKVQRNRMAAELARFTECCTAYREF